MSSPKYKRGSAWKRANWDKWTIWKKMKHILAVCISLFVTLIMVAFFFISIVYMLGLEKALLQLRDTFLLEIIHWIIGR